MHIECQFVMFLVANFVIFFWAGLCTEGLSFLSENVPTAAENEVDKGKMYGLENRNKLKVLKISEPLYSWGTSWDLSV